MLAADIGPDLGHLWQPERYVAARELNWAIVYGLMQRIELCLRNGLQQICFQVGNLIVIGSDPRGSLQEDCEVLMVNFQASESRRPVRTLPEVQLPRAVSTPTCRSLTRHVEFFKMSGMKNQSHSRRPDSRNCAIRLGPPSSSFIAILAYGIKS